MYMYLKAIHAVICVNFEWRGKCMCLITNKSYLYSVNYNAQFDHVTNISNIKQ